MDETALFARVIMGGWLVLLLIHHLPFRPVDGGWMPHLPVGCPFRWFTGIQCPGCGMTRAFVSLADLDIRGAMALNPWSPLLFIYLSAEAVGMGRPLRPFIRTSGPILLGMVVAWWFLWRLVPQLV